MELTDEDRRRIAEYRAHLDKYPHPSVTADIIAVRPARIEPESGNWRESSRFALELLLIRRGQWPHEGCWALPGGFVRPDESVEEGARRELREETALDAHPLIPVGTFSKPGRDMRAWIVSNAFVSVYRIGEGCNVKGGDDAASARWLRVESAAMDEPVRGKDPRRVRGFRIRFLEGTKPAFTLQGTCEPGEFDGGRVLSVKANPLAFDHAEIIATAFLRMLAFDPLKLAFYFLPEKFSLPDFIDVYQFLTNDSVVPVNIPNFRRRLTATKEPLLEICPGEVADREGRGHAPAQLYRRHAGAR